MCVCEHWHILLQLLSHGLCALDILYITHIYIASNCVKNEMVHMYQIL